MKIASDRVLLVEDDEDVIDLVDRYLRQAGIRLAVATDGAWPGATAWTRSNLYFLGLAS